MKICTECEREFTPSSRHKKCPKCRSPKHNYKLCSCGNKMAKTSSRCNTCRLAAPYARPKGGRTKHKAGYVMLRVPEHPRSKSNSGYVFEHILVMEEYLGRLLVSGVRAEDLYHWALNIV